MEPLDPYTLAVRAEVGAVIRSDTRFFVKVWTWTYLDMPGLRFESARPTFVWEIVMMPLAIVIRCAELNSVKLDFYEFPNISQCTCQALDLNRNLDYAAWASSLHLEVSNSEDCEDCDLRS